MESIRTQLASGPVRARQLSELIGISQPTISRALNSLGNEIIRIGAGPSIQYALRDQVRGLSDIPIYRVDIAGRIRQLGTLVPVRPEGFVMLQDDGDTLHTHGLPWWLFDMRPQGYLGRAYALRHATELGLPAQLNEWSDTHALRALLAHGHDAVGNLLLGESSRGHFLTMPSPAPIPVQERGEAFVRMAEEAARGEVPGSSAGGEQPKFTAYVETPNGSQHVLVKFTNARDNEISERWRDLLLAEHLAMQTLRQAGISAAETQIVDYGLQRFLQVERFDRIGERGRRGVFSLAALDAEFVGAGTGGWHVIAAQLARSGEITRAAAEGAALLYAFGTLIGNTDMHTGNIAFMSDHGRPYDLAPAYDMLPMSFSPRSGGGLLNVIPPATIHAGIENAVWRHAVALAEDFLQRLRTSAEFSREFFPCIAVLERHLNAAMTQIERLAAF
jgi:hypothetical protein